MPRVKSLFKEIKTYPFEVKIKSIFYRTINSKTKVSYCASCTAIELRDGEEKDNKNLFKLLLWMSEPEYEVRQIRKNDIIKLSDQIKWFSQGEYIYYLYDREKIAKENPRNIKVNPNGKPYVEEKIYPFLVYVPEGEWKILDRYSQDFMAKLGVDLENSIELYFDTREEVLEFNGGDFYITDEEYETLKEQNHKFVTYMPYVHRIKTREKKFRIEIKRDFSIQQWILTIKNNSKGELKK